MKLTDQKAINIYKRLKSSDLLESIDEYPEDERDGRNDLQFLADEISYFRHTFETDGYSLNTELVDSKALLSKTKNGVVIPLNPKTLKIKRGYYPFDIEHARNVIAEYKQIKYYEKRLNSLGYFGQW